MIYIFDDKRLRQYRYNWTEERFDQYSNYIHPIYHYSDVENDTERKKIFSKENIVLFHESFFDAEFNKHIKESLIIRRDLETFAQENSNFYLAFFSGSKNERTLKHNVAYLPVSVLYQNLEELIIQSRNGYPDLKYLLYGKRPEIEKDYVEKLMDANLSFESKTLINPSLGENILFARSISNQVPNIINDVEYKVLIDDSDLYFHEKTIEWFKEKRYDKIFIPLCFGSSLSDFNGLRFATHIRCTLTLNQCTQIYIYSFIEFIELANHEYFDILKTKNVKLVQYGIPAFEYAMNSKLELMDITEIPHEIAKLKLDIPKNYEDNHGIANEWAIYRWAKATGADVTSFKSTIEKVNTQLYFKYLRTIYPISKMPKIFQDKMKLNNQGKPKILFIDDDAENGWYELICWILADLNGLTTVDYLGDELKNISQIEILEMAINKILTDEIDLVILDFRLHPNDLIANDIQDVTGLKLLMAIKKLNPGIQVIIFSATNKVWNFQALQNAGADGFVIKESPENSTNSSFTIRSVSEFIKTIDECIGRMFLKRLFKTLVTIKNQLRLVEEVSENLKFNEFLKKLNIQFNVISSSALNIKMDKDITLDVVFLSCYAFFDLFKKYYLAKDQDHRYYLGFRKEELMRYNIEDNTIKCRGPYIPDGHYDAPGVFHVYSGLLKDYFINQNDYDINLYIKEFHQIRNFRNDYIHGSKKKFTKEDLLLIVHALLPITHNICE